jgi:hypothetical protein
MFYDMSDVQILHSFFTALIYSELSKEHQCQLVDGLLERISEEQIFSRFDHYSTDLAFEEFFNLVRESLPIGANVRFDEKVQQIQANQVLIREFTSILHLIPRPLKAVEFPRNVPI